MNDDINNLAASDDAQIPLVKKMRALWSKMATLKILPM
jgi:hypothetical protein